MKEIFDEDSIVVAEKILILQYIEKHYDQFKLDWPNDRVERLRISIGDELNDY